MLASNRLMAAAILAVIFCASVQAQEVEVLKVEVALVTVNVNVSDVKGRPLSSLKAEDFEVTDEGQKVSLGFFECQGPASIVLVVDISSSMRGPKWRSLKTGLKEFLARAPAGNDYTLVTFSDSPQLLAHSVHADELWRILDGLHPLGHTALYDAMLLGLNILGELPQRHKSLVLFSDGEDNVSRVGLPAVQQEALSRRATIYTVGILPDDPSMLVYGQKGKQLLRELATSTGGLVHFPLSGEVDAVLRKINTDMSNQYSLGYYPPDKTPGRRRIQVNLPQDTGSLKLRYQQSYLIR
jgi:Ca-activated chloride channel homolog